MIPQNFAEWQICITQHCKTPLTKSFAEQRLAVYTQPQLPETKKFIDLYGQQHLNNIIDWLQLIAHA